MSSDVYGGVFSLQPAEIYGAPTAGYFPGISEYADTEDGGKYFVAGTIGIDSTPDIMVRRQVRLICKRSGRLVREVWSDATTGAYRFDHIRIGPWLVVGHDYTNSFNAVVADNISGVAE